MISDFGRCNAPAWRYAYKEYYNARLHDDRLREIREQVAVYYGCHNGVVFQAPLSVNTVTEISPFGRRRGGEVQISPVLEG